MFSILLIVLYALAMTLLFVHAAVTLAWMLYTWRSPDAATDAGFVMIRRRPKNSFTLLVPARHEEGVLGETLDRLAGSDHPVANLVAIAVAMGWNFAANSRWTWRTATPDRGRFPASLSWKER